MWGQMIVNVITWFLASEQYQQLTGNVPLVPREKFFGNPSRINVQISPDGLQLAYSKAWNDVLNIWVVSTADIQGGAGIKNERPVTFDKGRGITGFFWSYLPSTLLYVQDSDGDENYRLYSLDVSAKNVTPKVISETPGVRVQIAAVSYKYPNTILIGLNDRKPSFHDVYKVNLDTGEKTLVFQNDYFVEPYFDLDYNLKIAANTSDDGGTEYYSSILNDTSNTVVGWSPYKSVSFEDSGITSFVGFNLNGSEVYWLDSTGRDKATLISADFVTKRTLRTILEPTTRGEISVVSLNEVTREIQYAFENYDIPIIHVIDEKLKADIAYIQKLEKRGYAAISSADQGNTKWVITWTSDIQPSKYYFYDRQSNVTTFLFSARPELEKYTFSQVNTVEVTSRDGLVQQCYLTLPKSVDPNGVGRPSQPSPMVLYVHGGPWSRDSWGFDNQVQWFSNRGHAVLQCNFRASSGFGKKHLNAGNGEWAGKMQTDLEDAVRWAVAGRIADKDRVAIFGGSYGGYATLVGLSFTPDMFACGVDIVGPSNLITLINSIPAYWKPLYSSFIRRLGADPNTPEGKAILEHRSPLFHAHKIRKPLLIGQGSNDVRVKQNESDQIVTALREARIPVTYLVFPNEGHGFVRPENKNAFNALTEKFLHTCLGGRLQPVEQSVIDASSVQIS